MLGFTRLAILTLTLAALLTPSLRGADYLQNDQLQVQFDRHGLVAIHDRETHDTVRIAQDSFSLLVGEEALDGDFLAPDDISQTPGAMVYRFSSGPWTVKVVYELRPGWRFVSKQLWLSSKTGKDYQVRRVEPFRGQIAHAIAQEQVVRSAALVRLGGGSNPARGRGIFFALQNPFLQWKRLAGQVSAAYAPDLPWQPAYGPFASDRVCLGLYRLTGARYPVQMVPEWKFNPPPVGAGAPVLDVAEEEALTDCARAFVLEPRVTSIRVHVGWCENDYQIEIATPEGREEYRRIIDQAAALGCQHVLFAPGNREVSSIEDNRDAWGWENILWLGLGQRIRKGYWDPAKDRLPASVREMIDYAARRDVKFLAYVYPSLPFLQNPEWTKWITGAPGGYRGADTGQRSFQDWLLDKLLAFRANAGISGYSFDHWFIAYDNASSKYAQWFGCRRVLETLRQRAPDIVIDGRQQYQYSGVWTWLAGSYPHPLSTDEQPQSFRAFPDLHLDRVSADRQRYTAWWYRMTQFCPPELMPGFITHQTPRSDEHNVMRRDRFRTRDWDYLGWRYSLLSAIATAPFNAVINMIPARDPDEFARFSDTDKQWFRDWLDWADRNLATLRRVRPILGQPRIGHVDGTAAFDGDRGFIFLFNPNYRVVPAEFHLDASIGLQHGKQFSLRQLYPDGGKGMRIPGPRRGFWPYGAAVTVPMPGTDALVLEVAPAPGQLTEPMLFNAAGRASVQGDDLVLTEVTGEAGTTRDLQVRLPKGKSVRAVTVNGKRADFRQSGDLVSLQVRFAGEAFPRCPQIGRYDPRFTGGAFQADIAIPTRVFEQLRHRREEWPIPYTADDLRATWRGPDRLLLFVNIADPLNPMEATLKIDGEPVKLQKAYSCAYPQTVERTFVGWYADVSALKPGVPHKVAVELPKLEPGQFQGLFLDNVEAEFTREITAGTPSREASATLTR